MTTKPYHHAFSILLEALLFLTSACFTQEKFILMRIPKLHSAVFILLALLPVFFTATAQEFEVPADFPKAKEDYTASEKDMIAAAKWLESTPVGTDMEKRVKANAWVIAWISGSPTVNVEIHAAVVKPLEKNPQLLSVWMAGYTRYCLENNYSTDKLKASVADMKSVIACYNLGGDLKKDKALTKLIDDDKDGKLGEWVTRALNSK